MQDDANKKILQFTQDIEFLQLLSNPTYLVYLSEKGFLDDNDFLNYIEYLNYLKNPQFSKFVIYTKSFVFLDLLQIKSYREEIKYNKEYPNFLNYLYEVDWFRKKEEIVNNLK